MIARAADWEGFVGLIAAAVLLAAFVINVTLGSITGSPVLGNVAEMCLLFAASIAFVVAILQRETAERRQNKIDE